MIENKTLGIDVQLKKPTPWKIYVATETPRWLSSMCSPKWIFFASKNLKYTGTVLYVRSLCWRYRVVVLCKYGDFVAF
jgi:hypothetical protein